MDTSSQKDTKKLLRECDAGIKMGIASLDNVLSSVNSYEIEQRLRESKQEHLQLRARAEKLLSAVKDEGKAPNPMAKTMSRYKTKMATMMDDTDRAPVKLITKGCEMGISSLNKYMDKYEYADNDSVKLARDVISEENALMTDLGRFNIRK